MWTSSPAYVQSGAHRARGRGLTPAVALQLGGGVLLRHLLLQGRQVHADGPLPAVQEPVPALLRAGAEVRDPRLLFLEGGD